MMMTMQATVTPAYVDYKGAEAYTGLNRVTLWKALKRGELKAAKVGSAVRFKIADLDEFMASKAAQQKDRPERMGGPTLRG